MKILKKLKNLAWWKTWQSAWQKPRLKKQVQPWYTLFTCVKTATPILWMKTLGSKLLQMVKTIRLLSTYHQSDRTPLYRFTEALKGNIKALKRFPWGNAKLALTYLYDDYGIISGNKQYINEIRQLKALAATYNRIIQLRFALYLSDTRLIRKLTGTTNPKAAAGTLKIWISEYEKNSDALNKKPSSEKSKEGFEAVLAEISKHMGFRINPKEVTVAEFASMVGNYSKEIEIKKQHYGK